MGPECLVEPQLVGHVVDSTDSPYGGAFVQLQGRTDSAQAGQIILVAECQAQRLDFLRGAVRKIGDGAIFDLIPLAIGPTQEDTAIHRTVGAKAGGFDNIHSNYDYKEKSKKIQERESRSSDYRIRLLIARNLQVFKGLDRRMGGGHPLQARVLAFIQYFNATMAKPFKWTYGQKPLYV